MTVGVRRCSIEGRAIMKGLLTDIKYPSYPFFLYLQVAEFCIKEIINNPTEKQRKGDITSVIFRIGIPFRKFF